MTTINYYRRNGLRILEPPIKHIVCRPCINKCKANGEMPTLISDILLVSTVVKGSIKAVVSETIGKRGTKQRFPNPNYQPTTRALFNEAKDMTRCVRSRGLNHNFQPSLRKVSTTRWNAMGDHLMRIVKRSNHNRLPDRELDIGEIK